ncbi:MAG: hypothetical protein HFH93_12985 [Lachnospiraceae bacterium]|nr:hypothetical protein [Lachnospiraceae bacterium]
MNLSYNQTLREFYEDNKKSGDGRSQANSDLDSGNEVSYLTGETPPANYDSNNIQASFETTDAAVIVISRLGGEGADLPKNSAESDRHYLALDDNEFALVDMVTDYGFSSVTVVINSANVMELGPLEDNADVDAILWIGTPGDTGIMALGEILTGKVNPSGKTVDTYSADFTKDPSYQNFGYISDYYMSSENGDGILYNKWDGQVFFSRYQEGIYTGYRYYETADYEAGQGNYEGFDYDSAVVYPFGYGLSYTTFEWEIKDDSGINGVTVEKDGTYSVTVTVTNTGDYAGKDVVELYVSAPYMKGGIEKADKVLCGYVKTGLLEPGESGDYTIEITPYDFASYDYNDANQNGFTGYELDGGDYMLFVSRSAHDDAFEIDFCVPAEGIRYETDPNTGNTVENRFDDADDALGTVMSRGDFVGTFPERATDEYRLNAVTEEILESINSTANNNSEAAGFTEVPITGAAATVILRDLLYDAETGEFAGSVDFDDPRWDAVLDAVTFEEMVDLVNYGNLMTKAIDSVGKNQTIESDGPTGFSSGASMDVNIYDTCAYCSEVVLASTWNVELVAKMGECLGEEALWGNENSSTPYSAIYAPGANIHRSPFGGRNGEYFSEDSFLSGTMAGSEIAGARVLRNEWGFNGTVITDWSGEKYMSVKQMVYAGGDLNFYYPIRVWNSADSTDAADVTVLRKAVKGILYSYVNSNAMNGEAIGYRMANWQFTFEAEDVSFTGKSSPVFSGATSGTAMIVPDLYNRSASNGYYVMGLYSKTDATYDTTLEFNIVASEDMENVKPYLRLSAAYADMTINGSTYQVVVNGTTYDYGDISFSVPEGADTYSAYTDFEDYLISSSVKHQTGENVIQLVVNNADSLGGTTRATAPCVDAVRISTTKGTLAWADGFPKTTNYAEDE